MRQGLSQKVIEGKPKTPSRLAANSASIFSAQFFVVLATALTHVLLARWLGPADKGAFTLITLLPWLIVEAAHLGMGPASIFILGNRGASLHRTTGTLLTFGLVWGGLVVGAALFFSPYIFDTFFRGINPAYMVAVLLLTPVFLATAYFNSVFLAADKIGQFNFLTAIRPVLFLGGLFVALLSPWNGLLGAVGSWIIALVVTSILYMILIHRLSGISFRPDFSLINKMLRYGLKAYMGTLLLFFNYRFDLLLVGMFLGTYQVGIYSIALAVAEMIWRIPNSIGLALFPLAAASDLDQNLARTPVVCRNATLLAALACVPFYVAGHWIVSATFSASFLPAVEALWILLPGVVIFSGARILISHFDGVGKPGITSIGASISFVTMVGLDIVLIPKLGISGAAIGSTAAYSVFAAVLLVVFIRDAKVSWHEVLAPRLSDMKLYATVAVRAWSLGKSAAQKRLSFLRQEG